MAVAIDGEICQDAFPAAFKPDSEIYLICKSAAADRELLSPDRRGCVA
jgi:hypothetical protein